MQVCQNVLSINRRLDSYCEHGLGNLSLIHVILLGQLTINEQVLLVTEVMEKGDGRICISLIY